MILRQNWGLLRGKSALSFAAIPIRENFLPGSSRVSDPLLPDGGTGIPRLPEALHAGAATRPIELPGTPFAKALTSDNPGDDIVKHHHVMTALAVGDRG